MPTPRYSLVGRSGRRSGIQMAAAVAPDGSGGRQSLGSSRSVVASAPSSLQQSAIRRVASAIAAVGSSSLARRGAESPSGSDAAAGGSGGASSQSVPGSEMSLLDTILSSHEASDTVHAASDPASPAPGSTLSEAGDDLSPLFWQPGKAGFYSPRMGRPSLQRHMAYRNVGRVMGLCLLMGEISPLRFNRHVLKFVMGRQPAWHDMAFFDPSMYEGMRQLLVLADQGNAEAILSTELYFTIRLGGDEAPSEQVFDLVPGGSGLQVTADNVFDYVRRYCEFRMVRSVKEPLEQMKLGLADVIPASALEGLTAEDLRLLLNGSGEIDIAILQSYTVFSDESGEAGKKIARFKKWFWQCLERMPHSQRQDLIYFWTSSPALPASEQGFQPTPSVTVRPADDQHLPTANTCISRLYIPLYSSKQLLRTKLLQAIETKSFGFV